MIVLWKWVDLVNCVEMVFDFMFDVFLKALLSIWTCKLPLEMNLGIGRFCPFVGFWRFYLWMYVDLMTCIFWRCMTYICCDCWWILYMHVVWILMWRRSVYFLNIYIIRVYYRFNRNRALHRMPELKKVILGHIWSDARKAQPLENQTPDAAKSVTAKEQVICNFLRTAAPYTDIIINTKDSSPHQVFFCRKSIAKQSPRKQRNL